MGIFSSLFGGNKKTEEEKIKIVRIYISFYNLLSYLSRSIRSQICSQVFALLRMDSLGVMWEFALLAN